MSLNTIIIPALQAELTPEQASCFDFKNEKNFDFCIHHDDFYFHPLCAASSVSLTTIQKHRHFLTLVGNIKYDAKSSV